MKINAWRDEMDTLRGSRRILLLVVVVAGEDMPRFARLIVVDMVFWKL